MPRASISPSEWLALLRIAEAGGEIRQRDLAECLDLTEAPATRLVHRLAAQGLVVQGINDHDRRSRSVRLTPAANAYVKLGEEIGERLRGQVFDALTPDEVTTALKVLRVVIERLD